MTFKQALELGANVRKGEHGHLVVYAYKLTKTEANANGEEAERAIAFMKGYTVFNVDQMKTCPRNNQTHPEPAHQPTAKPLQLIEYVEEFFAKTGAAVSITEDSGRSIAEDVALDSLKNMVVRADELMGSLASSNHYDPWLEDYATP